MKELFTALIVLISLTSFGQNEINQNNYFDYFSKGENIKGQSLTTAWLNKIEVVSVLAAELEEAGYENVSTFRIIEIDSVTVVTSICYSEKSNCGFLYESSHKAFPVKEDRNLISLYKEFTGNDYSEKVIQNNGTSKFIKIKEVPENLFIIKENNYWYQYTDNKRDDENLVRKEDIIEILKADIRAVLKDKK